MNSSVGGTRLSQILTGDPKFPFFPIISNQNLFYFSCANFISNGNTLLLSKCENCRLSQDSD